MSFVLVAPGGITEGERATLAAHLAVLSEFPWFTPPYQPSRYMCETLSIYSTNLSIFSNDLRFTDKTLSIYTSSRGGAGDPSGAPRCVGGVSVVRPAPQQCKVTPVILHGVIKSRRSSYTGL